MTAAFSTEQAKTVGIFAIGVVVLAGILLSVIITKITGRIIVLAVVAALGIFVWVQRGAIDDAAKKCDATFFGIHLTPSDQAVKKHCQQLSNR